MNGHGAWSQRGQRPQGLLLILTVMVVAANLRPAITVVGPLIEQIGAETGLSPTSLGVLGAVPVLAFGVVAPFVHRLGTRWGLDLTIAVALTVLAVGTALRSLIPHEVGLYLGTALLSAAIGVGNVLVPAVVKRDFPDHVPMMTGLYTAALVGSAAVFSAAAVPLAQWTGWQTALGSAAVLAILAAAIWSLRLLPSTGAPARAAVEPAALLTGVPAAAPVNVWRSRLAWQVTAYFGLQSGLFYMLLTWLPAIQTSHGAHEAAAGLWLGAFQAVGILASLIIGQIMQRAPDQRRVSSVVALFMVVGLLGMIFAPSLMPLWALLAGISTGSALLLALTFISLRARTTAQVGQLSGMAQGVGYVFAAAGPVIAGALFQAAGSWTPVLWAALGLCLAQAGMGLLAGRSIRLD